MSIVFIGWKFNKRFLELASADRTEYVLKSTEVKLEIYNLKFLLF